MKIPWWEVGCTLLFRQSAESIETYAGKRDQKQQISKPPATRTTPKRDREYKESDWDSGQCGMRDAIKIKPIQ